MSKSQYEIMLETVKKSEGCRGRIGGERGDSDYGIRNCISNHSQNSSHLLFQESRWLCKRNV